MCGRLANDLPPGMLASIFGTLNALPNLAPSWNVAPSQDALVVRRNPDGGAEPGPAEMEPAAPPLDEGGRQGTTADQRAGGDRRHVGHVQGRARRTPVPGARSGLVRMAGQAGRQGALRLRQGRRGKLAELAALIRAGGRVGIAAEAAYYGALETMPIAA